MDKPHVEHISNDEKSDGSRGVDKFPPEARAEAGVRLEVEGAGATSLRLAEDGHVSVEIIGFLSLLTTASSPDRSFTPANRRSQRSLKLVLAKEALYSPGGSLGCSCLRFYVCCW